MVGESVKSEEAVLLFIVDLLTAAKFTRAYNMYNKNTICKIKYYLAKKIQT
jgi:hypothetical protein